MKRNYPEAAQSIIDDAFKLPRQLSHGVLPGHIRMSTTVFGVQRYADAVFASPSHKYCMAPAYSQCGSLAGTLRFMLHSFERVLAM